MYIWRQIFRRIHTAVSISPFTHTESYNYITTSAGGSQQTKRDAGANVHIATLETKQTHTHSWIFLSSFPTARWAIKPALTSGMLPALIFTRGHDCQWRVTRTQMHIHWCAVTGVGNVGIRQSPLWGLISSKGRRSTKCYKFMEKCYNRSECRKFGPFLSSRTLGK